jgi:hypothetical protein
VNLFRVKTNKAINSTQNGKTIKVCGLESDEIIRVNVTEEDYVKKVKLTLNRRKLIPKMEKIVRGWF